MSNLLTATVLVARLWGRRQLTAISSGEGPERIIKRSHRIREKTLCLLKVKQKFGYDLAYERVNTWRCVPCYFC